MSRSKLGEDRAEGSEKGLHVVGVRVLGVLA